MRIQGKHYRTIWLSEEDPTVVRAIDQRHLPFHLVIEEIRTVTEMTTAIKEMHVRGAGLIGAAAGYGMYLAALEADGATEAAITRSIESAAQTLKASRPTAVNLAWAVNRQLAAMAAVSGHTLKVDAARQTAQTIADEDAQFCRCIGEHGLPLIEAISRRKSGGTVNVLTHCNAGWLAFVDYGSATSPIYAAHDRGMDLHVWVDETRPRNQGARLTEWELSQHGVSNTVVVDNAGGHLMQHGMVDMVIVGSDRTTRTGDVANKIGTYLKALAAHDNGIPFYVALPSSSIDWTLRDGVREIPIEDRDPDEVLCIDGWSDDSVRKVHLTSGSARAANCGFDVTPARLVTGLITERGVCRAEESDILRLFPEHGSG